MKKEWLNPELMNLGVKSTKDDCYEQVNVDKEGGGQERFIWRCKHCGATAFIIPDIKHETWCPHVNEPACPGFGPEGPVTPELEATPVS